MLSILVVDEQDVVVQALGSGLGGSRYRLTSLGTGAEARASIAHLRPDLIVLDLQLPDIDGLVLLPALRALTSAPIMICTARGAPHERVRGLRLGADDFVTKPFDPHELEARVEAVLRRSGRPRPTPTPTHDQLRVGGLVIAPARGAVTLDGQAVHLTPTELRLLVALASWPDEVHSRAALGESVWGYQDAGTGHLIDVHIGRIRLKLRHAGQPPPAVITTVRGRGYTISSSADGGLDRTDGVSTRSQPKG